MNCPNCKNEVQNSYKFCDKCGCSLANGDLGTVKGKSKKSTIKKFLKWSGILVLFFLVLAIVIGVFGKNSSAKSEKEFIQDVVEVTGINNEEAKAVYYQLLKVGGSGFANIRKRTEADGISMKRPSNENDFVYSDKKYGNVLVRLDNHNEVCFVDLRNGFIVIYKDKITNTLENIYWTDDDIRELGKISKKYVESSLKKSKLKDFKVIFDFEECKNIIIANNREAVKVPLEVSYINSRGEKKSEYLIVVVNYKEKKAIDIK